MRARLIIASEPNGNREEVTFLDADDTTPAADYLRPGQGVDFDEVIDCDLPDRFPVGRGLKVAW